MPRWNFEPLRPVKRLLPKFEGDLRDARRVARDHARELQQTICMAPEDEPGDWEEISPDEDLGY